jgi:hypothetical protein
VSWLDLLAAGAPTLAILAFVGLVAWACLSLLFSPKDGAYREWIWKDPK